MGTDPTTDQGVCTYAMAELLFVLLWDFSQWEWGPFSSSWVASSSLIWDVPHVTAT